MLQTPGPGPEHIHEKKTVFFKFDCFSVLSSTSFYEAFYSHILKLSP